MSLVGTRPILQDELRQYELHHRARIAIKPGITGMWQVSGRSDITDFEEVVRLDTEYVPLFFICSGYLYQKYSRVDDIKSYLKNISKKALALADRYIPTIRHGIFELRTKQGSDITRVLYFFVVGKKAILTNGFIKKSQKTPKAEKELAKKYKADYERRYGKEDAKKCILCILVQRKLSFCYIDAG